MGYRLGSALILLGIIVLVIFLVTLTTGQETVITLLLGAASSIIGLYLHRRNAPPAHEPTRFRMLRRFLGRSKEEG